MTKKLESMTLQQIQEMNLQLGEPIKVSVSRKYSQDGMQDNLVGCYALVYRYSSEEGGFNLAITNSQSLAKEIGQYKAQLNPDSQSVPISEITKITRLEELTQ